MACQKLNDEVGYLEAKPCKITRGGGTSQVKLRPSRRI